jgi:DegV family protein with EDD domain
MGNHRIAIVTDSTSDLPPEMVEQYGITIVPLYVLWGDEQLRDGVDISNDEFYARLPTDPNHPTTSQPTPADFVRAIKGLDAEQVVIITLGRRLSATYESASMAAEMVDLPVHVMNSNSVSMGLGWQVIAAARVREQGGDAAAMLAEAERVRQGLSVLFVVDTLDYLHKGGRIGGAARLLGSALQLKPLLEIDADVGVVDSVERIRTRQRSLKRLVEATFERLDPDRPLRISILSGGAPEETQALFDEMQQTYQPLELTIAKVSPVIGTHAGPGLVGLGGYNDA